MQILRPRLLLLLMVIALIASVAPAVGGAARAAADPAPENTVFWYQNLRASTDMTAFGHPQTVVLGPQRNAASEMAAVAKVHAIGAKAYRYIQYYWLPRGATYQDVDLADHPDWAFCTAGTAPSEGRLEAGIHWDFIDLNERAARDAMLAFTQKVQGWGYDGVMIDRGQAALAVGKDDAGRRIWNMRSTCTADPVAPSATTYFADAYVNMTKSVHDLGLDVLLNYGTSPFDPKLALRPDPSDPRCNLSTSASVAQWAQCRRKSDVWPAVTAVLVENYGHDGADRVAEDYAAGAATEAHGRPVVGLLKESETSPGPQRAQAYYTWARAKLFPQGLAINTGDDRCHDQPSAACQRNGLFPDLVDAQLGAPTSPGPTAAACGPTAATAALCLYSRTYQLGTVVANATAGSGTAQALPRPDQDLLDQYGGQVVTADTCGAGIPVPAWSGRLFMSRPRSTTGSTRRGAVVVDGWGGLHTFAVGGCTPAATGTNGGPYWNGWDIVRGVALAPDSSGGYVLDGYGGLHPFGMGTHAPAPSARFGPYWNRQDLARGVAMLPDGSGGYVLDGWGGMHPFAVGDHAPPPAVRANAYWPGWDIARGVSILPDGSGGYVVDGWGGLHPFAIGNHALPAPIRGGPYWTGWDIVRGLTFLPGGNGGYVLDGWGGMHPLPGSNGWWAPLATTAPYWPGWTIARGVAISAAG